MYVARSQVKPGMDGFLLLAPSEDQIQRMFFLPVCSSSMCILNVIEQSGKELLKCSMSWAVIVSIGLCTVISCMYCTCMHVKSIPSSSSMKLLSYIRWHWPSRVKMFVSFMHASVAGVISVGHLVVATSTMEVHKRLMFAG